MATSKKPGTPVSETLKRSIKRNMQRGIWGSKGPRRVGSYSCTGPSTSMSGLDLGSVNPNGYSTLSNGAWAWHVAPDLWFERWVPKPRKGENPAEWAIRLAVLCYFKKEHEGVPQDVIEEAAVISINAEFAHLDWVDGVC